VTPLSAVPGRLKEVGSGPDLLAWLATWGLDPELVCFAAHALASDLGVAAVVAEPTDLTASFLTGFYFGICVHEGASPRAAAPDATLAAALAAVTARGCQAIIADHCDLAAVASVETSVADAICEDEAVDETVRALVVRLFELGLATGLAAATQA
jgi:hypothetical protein